MRKYYPDIVETYEESIKKPPKEKKTRARKKKDNDNLEKPKRKYNRKPKNIEPIDIINESMKALELITTEHNSSHLNVSVSINKLKRKIKTNTKKGQKTLTSFITNKKRRTSKNLMLSLRQSFNKNIPVLCNDNNTDNVAIDDNCAFGKMVDYYKMLNKTPEDVNESDLSDIIDKIITRPPEVKTTELNNNLVRLVFDKYSTPKKMSMRKSILTHNHNNCSTPNDSPIRKSKFRFSTNSNNNSMIGKVNTSYFFDKLTEDCDAFEMSIEHKSGVVHLDSTVEYSLPDIYF